MHSYEVNIASTLCHFYSQNCFFQSSIQGLTGKVKFDEQGFRSEFVLDLIYLTKDGLEKVSSFFNFQELFIRSKM